MLECKIIYLLIYISFSFKISSVGTTTCECFVYPYSTKSESNSKAIYKFSEFFDIGDLKTEMKEGCPPWAIQEVICLQECISTIEKKFGSPFSVKAKIRDGKKFSTKFCELIGTLAGTVLSVAALYNCNDGNRKIQLINNITRKSDSFSKEALECSEGSVVSEKEISK